jgi:TPR repeat protein
MHGVHVPSGKERWILVIWFGENEESVKSKTVPWVIREAKNSVHAAFLFAYNSQHGLLGFDQDLEVAKQYYSWASQRGHALSEYKMWLMEEEEMNIQ